MADYQKNIGEFEKNNIHVYAMSTDDLEHAKEMVDKHGLTFPVLYGLDGPKQSEIWGAYYEAERNIIHATNFILSPDRKIITASYSTAAVGRIVPQDALDTIAFYKTKMAGV